MGWAFGIFLMRQFFLQISSEMEDAAKIDGANAFQIFIRIFVPLSKPVLATLAVFAFLYTWNDLLGPIIYLTTQEKMTLTVGIATFKGFQYNRFDLFMAGALISVVPILIIFVIAQKYFVRGDNDKRRTERLSGLCRSQRCPVIPSEAEGYGTIVLAPVPEPASSRKSVPSPSMGQG